MNDSRLNNKETHSRQEERPKTALHARCARFIPVFIGTAMQPICFASSFSSNFASKLVAGVALLFSAAANNNPSSEKIQPPCHPKEMMKDRVVITPPGQEGGAPSRSSYADHLQGLPTRGLPAADREGMMMATIQ